jgi:nicotinamidase-related amidase
MKPTCSLAMVTFVLLGVAAVRPAENHLGLTLRGSPETTLRLSLRSRVQPFKGSDLWEEVALVKELPAKETAILICDMWDNHWCQAAAKRCDALARKMEPVLQAARKKGVRIIHSPSDCMDFYKDAPQRLRMKEVKKVDPLKPIALPDPPLPIDDKAGGCDDPNPTKSFKAWSRQHPAITIAEQDVISDNGIEVYSLLKEAGVKNLIVMGVHTNMCVLHRTFGIKQMTRWGVRCILVRDLTDTMYDPRAAPYVSHDEGTELVVQYIEKHWCPTVLSKELTH